MQKNVSLTYAALLLAFIATYSIRAINHQESEKTQKPAIRFLCTAAIIPRDYEARKYQYIRSLLLLKQHGIDAYLVESCQNGPTFLDPYCSHICYTKTNNAALSNYGINEATSLLAGLKYFNFGPEDMIIKFTGRYFLEGTEFIDLVKVNPQADVIARAWNEGDAYTALFAIKAKYFLDFLEHNIDVEDMEKNHVCFEHYFGRYVTKMKKEGANVVYLNRVYDYLPVVAAIGKR